MDSGLWRYTPNTGEWKQYPTPDSPMEWNRFGFVDQLAIAPNGDPWVSYALCGGASCFGPIARFHIHEENWVLIGEIDESTLNRFVFDAEETTWLVIEAGVFRISDNVPEFVAPL
jgi:hypothetical protein